jgi:predicted ATPase/DNA-binding SARP family transcriptional activator
MRAGAPVPVERLVDELWPEAPPATAKHSIQVYVSRLRRALDGAGEQTRIEAHGRAYALRLGDDELDLARFRRRLEDARQELASGEPADAARSLREALALWRGRALADLGDEPGVRDVVLELEELRLQALELRIEADLALGCAEELVLELERLIADHPAREHLRGQLMLALYRSGRQQDALDAYQRARQALMHELGLEPSPRLRQLEQAILRQDPALTVERAELRARRHLPAQPNALIGRVHELEELVELVGSEGVRLVTLTGTGGIGKTRLALAVAERLAASFRDGVWFVDLGPVFDPALVVPVIAQTLDVKEPPGSTFEAALSEHLGDKELLLVVDNFEHLLEAATALSTMLKEAPRLKLLITSRAALSLYGEHEFEVPALELPDAEGSLEPEMLERYESVALFLARARAVRPKFVLDSRTATTVADACVRLDGLPLAIELAAAQVRTLSPDELHLQLANRFELLRTRVRDVPERHKTMGAAIEWSHELLDERAKQLFAELSVFVGSFSRDAAERVCEAEPDSLAELVALNLLKPSGHERFVMLETIREFAAACVPGQAEANALRARHADYYRALVEAAETELEAGPEQRSWLDRLELERDNLRLATDHFQTSDEPKNELRFVTAGWRFWWLHGYVTEIRRAVEHALARVSEPTAREPGALEAASYLAYLQSDYERGESMARELEAHGRQAADFVVIGRGLHLRSQFVLQRGDVAAARALEQKAADLLGDDPWVRYVHQGLATIALLEGDLTAAREHLSRASDAAARIGDSDTFTAVLTLLAYALLDDGEYAGAVEALQEATDLARGFGDRVMLAARCAPAFADALAARGDAVRAVKLIGAARSERQRLGVAIGPNGRRIESRALQRAREKVDEQEFENALAEGRSTELRAALDDTLDVTRPSTVCD